MTIYAKDDFNPFFYLSRAINGKKMKIEEISEQEFIRLEDEVTHCTYPVMQIDDIILTIYYGIDGEAFFYKTTIL